MRLGLLAALALLSSCTAVARYRVGGKGALETSLWASCGAAQDACDDARAVSEASAGRVDEGISILVDASRRPSLEGDVLARAALAFNLAILRLTNGEVLEASVSLDLAIDLAPVGSPEREQYAAAKREIEATPGWKEASRGSPRADASTPSIAATLSTNVPATSAPNPKERRAPKTVATCDKGLYVLDAAKLARRLEKDGYLCEPRELVRIENTTIERADGVMAAGDCCLHMSNVTIKGDSAGLHLGGRAIAYLSNVTIVANRLGLEMVGEAEARIEGGSVTTATLPAVKLAGAAALQATSLTVAVGDQAPPSTAWEKGAVVLSGDGTAILTGGVVQSKLAFGIDLSMGSPAAVFKGVTVSGPEGGIRGNSSTVLDGGTYSGAKPITGDVENRGANAGSR